MNNKIFITFAFVVLQSATAFAQTTEDITITTYYPSPFGIYNELRSQRIAVGANYASAVWSWDTDGGNPEMNEFRQDADLIVAGNVGIGTVNPSFPAPNAMSGNLDVNDVWLRGAVPPRWASQSAVLDYNTCYQKQIGSPTGPHTGYCQQGYINVGGATDGNDWIPESIVCCQLQGITTVNWGTRPIWGTNCTNNPC